MPVTRRDLLRGIKDLLDVRREIEQDVRPSRVVGRAMDGRTLVMDLSGECVQPEGSSGYPGEIVTQLPGLRNRQGTAGVPLNSRRDAAALLWVDRLEPNFFPAGSAGLAVTVHGQGFTPSFVIEFLLPASETINPYIEIVSREYLSPTQFALVLNVDPAAPMLAAPPEGGAPIAYDDPARRFL